MEDYLEAMADDMEKAHEALRREMAKIRTGRASPRLVEGLLVHVSSYGATMPLNQLATITAPDARLLVVSPWDKSQRTMASKTWVPALSSSPNSAVCAPGEISRWPLVYG